MADPTTADLRPRTRAADAADLGALEQLAAGLQAHLRAERGGAVVLAREWRPWPPGPSLAAEVGDDAAVVRLGLLGDVAAGYAIASLVAARGLRLAVVRDLWVEPDLRGVGLGRLLLDDVLSWAADLRCDGIDALALPGDRATKNFFEAAGLVARTILVHRDLGST